MTQYEEPERRRSLTPGEVSVLRDVRAFWGPQNTESDVFVSDSDEAVLFVRARDLSQPLCIVLTNLARWRDDKTLSTWAYRRQIMGPSVGDRFEFVMRASYFVAQVRAFIFGWHRDA